MAKNPKPGSSDFIVSLNMNKLRGRILRLPPPGRKKREILVVYDHLTHLEELVPLAKELNKQGGITIPDIPGFGGMKSFYKINEKPTLDNLAGYMAAFIKLFYKKRRLSIVAIGFGFSIVTRMLQKYPDLTNKIDLLVSLDGYTHHEDFNLTVGQKSVNKMTSLLLSGKIPATLAKIMFLQPALVRKGYLLKVDNQSANEPLIEQSVKKWQKTDIRTHMSTKYQQYKLNLCNQIIDLSVKQIVYDKQGYNHDLVEQHLKVIYKEVQPISLTRLRKKKADNSLYQSVLPALKHSLKQQ